jgi:hypothetical protein
MMLLPSPVTLMLGYLLGALITSITLGLVILSSLEGSDAVRTVKQMLGRAATIILGVLFPIAVSVIGTGRYQRAPNGSTTARPAGNRKGRQHRRRRSGDARPGSPSGRALLTLRGATYGGPTRTES